MRLIDADVLKKSMCEICDIRHENNDERLKCRFIENVNNAPTVDAIPVIHADWIEVEPEHNFDNTKIVCSNCKEPNRYPTFNENYEVISYTYDRTKYCPNCGAMMDGTLIHN